MFLAYWPAWHGGFLWDDDTYITTNYALRSLTGLKVIWLKPWAIEQYYPLTFTLFWIGYHLWGLNTLGYHLLTLSLHCVTSLLLWQVLARLRVRGAFLAGAIFALHPVCVMSAAWMTELKNTLSGALALAAAWAYLRFAGLGVYDGGTGFGKKTVRPDWRYYVLALVLFQLALLAKTAVSFLPLTLFLIVWWQKGRVPWRNLWPLLPLLGMALAMGQVTSYVEQHSGGATGREFNIGFLERVLISGRSFWFYLGKIFFPWQLTFIYPRWQVDPGVWWQYLYPGATVGLLWGLWKMRHRFGKGLFVAMLHFYISTSFLILIVVLYMTRYSFVSDHWQYFGCMSVVALAAAGIRRVLDRFERGNVFLKPVFCGALLLVLGGLTWRQCEMYTDLETLWRVTLARNPAAWMAYNNWGELLFERGKVAEAIARYQTALQLNPDLAEVHNNFGAALFQQGKVDEAFAQYQEALQINPDFAKAHNNLGNLLLQQGKRDAAIAQYQEALQIDPHKAETYYNLGTALLQQGGLDQAVAQYQRALQINPDYPEAHNNLGNALSQQGNVNEAIAQYQKALQINPRYAEACYNLAETFRETGNVQEAIVYYQKAIQINPDYVEGLNNLARLLATGSQASLRNGDRAVQLARHANQLTGNGNPVVLATLAAAYAEAGRYTEAVQTALRALELATAQSETALAEAIRSQLKLYQAGQPFHTH